MLKAASAAYAVVKGKAGGGIGARGVSTALDTNGSKGVGTNGIEGGAAGAIAEASTTTVRTVIHGPSTAPTGSGQASLGTNGGGDRGAGQDAAAALIEGFEGTALDAQAEAEIGAALLALAARQRAMEAAVAENDPGAIAMQVDDPAVPLVRLGERDSPYYGPLQMHPGLGDADVDDDAAARIGGEAGWVAAGADIPEAYREWIAAAEAA